MVSGAKFMATIRDTRGLGGSSVEFVLTKLDQQDVKAAEFAPVAGKNFVAFYLLTW